MSNSLTWSSSIRELFKSKSSKSLEKLESFGIKYLKDLLWIFPLKVVVVPKVSSFNTIMNNQYFRGQAKVISLQSRVNFKSNSKSKIPLETISIIIQDKLSKKVLNLKWFNVYPSMAKTIKELTSFQFSGEVTSYQGNFQIVNPNIEEFNDDNHKIEFLISYPTVNTISPSHYKKVIEKIPFELWDNIEETLPQEIIIKRKFISLSKCFKKIHGQTSGEAQWNEIDLDQAKKRLIYEEFFIEQLKIHVRRKKHITIDSKPQKITDQEFKNILNIFPYELTIDQEKVLKDVREDLLSTKPMMRLVQGDVGCGKTTIAIVTSIITIINKAQVAIMCPTEALALQHFNNINLLIKESILSTINVELLIGSTHIKQKKVVKEKLINKEIDLIIGTHSLIQEDVKFNNLQLAIIDEQHKFGVEQRLKLSSKSKGCNSLIMTATPIPRSLSLTHYGDLDISTINVMPSGRKGTKTRIVNSDIFEKFLSFLKTRLSMKEQAYIVVPAISESPQMDLINLEQVLKKFKSIFKEYNIQGLHGQMSSEDKTKTFIDFTNQHIDVLISTSVVEVGINIPNATVMAIMNPERFGLSSLHQLRGRIGRGDKPGFFFLVLDKKVSTESLNRLKVIENTNDGFKIAEEDLKIRGEGNLFGKEQSGQSSQRKISNIILHQQVLQEARADLEELLQLNNKNLSQVLEKLSSEELVFMTV